MCVCLSVLIYSTEIFSVLMLTMVSSCVCVCVFMSNEREKEWGYMCLCMCTYYVQACIYTYMCVCCPWMVTKCLLTKTWPFPCKKHKDLMLTIVIINSYPVSFYNGWRFVNINSYRKLWMMPTCKMKQKNQKKINNTRHMFTYSETESARVKPQFFLQVLFSMPLITFIS